jgi:hypothetical protein
MTNIPNPTGTYNSACSDALISPTWIITAVVGIERVDFVR